MTVNAILDMIFSLVLTTIGIVGLALNSSIIKKGIRGETFIYYTSLSNITVVLYQLVLLISYSVHDSAFYRLVSSPVVRLTIMLMIMLTFVIYHFILRPEFRKNEISPMSKEKAIGNFCVHYLVPLLTFAQWIFVADKKGLLVSDGLIWIICPASYALFIVLRGRFIDLRNKKSGKTAASTDVVKYPYTFINIDSIGGARVALNIAVIGSICAVAGCLVAWIAIILSA